MLTHSSSKMAMYRRDKTHTAIYRKSSFKNFGRITVLVINRRGNQYCGENMTVLMILCCFLLAVLAFIQVNDETN